MREIKFRAWDKRFKRMHVPFVELGTDKYLANFPMPLGEQPLPQDTIMMQYTGLKDKNGKEIYEGDLTHAKGQKTVFKVEYYNGSFVLVPYHSHDKKFKEKWEVDNDTVRVMPLHTMINKGGIGQLEIIGNIYENKELLK